MITWFETPDFWQCVAKLNEVKAGSVLFRGYTQIDGIPAGISFQDGEPVIHCYKQGLVPWLKQTFSKVPTEMHSQVFLGTCSGDLVYPRQGLQIGTIFHVDKVIDPDGRAQKQVPFFNAENIYFNNRFPVFFQQVDLSCPETAFSRIMQLTEHVQEQCPVMAAFGHRVRARGILWQCVDSLIADSNQHVFLSE